MNINIFKQCLFLKYFAKMDFEQIFIISIEDECYELIDLAEEQGIIHRTKRNFANMKTLCFVSLQLDVISGECL
jgi:hypothetical protein